MRTRNRQQGAAVIVAMLIVALAAVSAVLLLQQQDATIRQLEAARDYEQARWLLKGGAHWARVILRTDARSSAIDHGGELWSRGLPPTDIEQGRLAGEIRDQQGLFNLNNLVRDGKPSARDAETFRRLLQALGLRTGLADAVIDWIDADDQVVSSDGAEDSYYLRLPAPYRSANQPLSGLEELLRVRGCDEALIQRLQGFVTALPRRTPVNVNLAPAEILVALVEGLTLPEARVLASARSTSPFLSPEDFRGRLPRKDLKLNSEDIVVGSQFFLVQGFAKVGKSELRMRALLERSGQALPAIVWMRVT